MSKMDFRTGFLAIIRGYDRVSGEQILFAKGPFDSERAGLIASELHIENANGPGGCGDFMVVPCAYGEHTHAYPCENGSTCGWIKLGK